jgi:hypothetical protein
MPQRAALLGVAGLSELVKIAVAEESELFGAVRVGDSLTSKCSRRGDG